MDVKRCENCKWWVREHEGEVPPEHYDGHNPCGLLSDSPSYSGPHKPQYRGNTEAAYIVPFAGADGGGLYTTASFGCALFEDREAA